MPRDARLWVGTSGWQYAHWKDELYAGAPKRKWLGIYSRLFPSVEVNGTYYGLPKPQSVEAWTQQVPAGFRFTPKMWRGVTHYRKLKESRALLERFFEAVGPLGPRQRGPVLVQLPPRWRADVDRLDGFLDDLRAVTRPARWKVAVEFRDPSWLQPDVFQVLEDQGAVPVVHDMRHAAANDEAGAGRWVYLRRHGPGGDMSRGYSDEGIREDARRVRGWLEEGRTVFAYYNNDIHGHAPRDAVRMRNAVS